MYSEEPGLIYATRERTADELFNSQPVDVVVDFSSETGLDYYGKAAARRGISIVTAVSQYSEEHLERLKHFSQVTKVMHSPNITVGINFLIIAAQILKRIAPYTDIEIIEEHFKQKTDVSGTARLIASTLDIPEENIKTVRAGGIIGVHEILFGFPFQTVRLRHESISHSFPISIWTSLGSTSSKPCANRGGDASRRSSSLATAQRTRRHPDKSGLPDHRQSSLNVRGSPQQTNPSTRHTSSAFSPSSWLHSSTTSISSPQRSQ